MIVVYTDNLKPEMWDCNLDSWLENWSSNGISACVMFVPGTYDEIEKWWDWEKVS